ncbi:MAG TPA: hypothetical protein VGM23_08160, partial [Armatimonadota bacterium]
ATSILMWVQDHDESFPEAASWVTELSSSYGVTGKVWDCPTSSFKGTEAGPDYFYVGGSFLSGAALGDVKDPVAAPLIADLKDSKSNKPYIMDNGSSNLTQAASQVDTRHNNGAVFAFVDGHMSWVTAAGVQPYIFLPSAIGINADMPTYMGNLFTTPLRFDQDHRDGVPTVSSKEWNDAWGDHKSIYNICTNANMPIAMGLGWTGGSTVMFYMGDSMNNWTLATSAFGPIPTALLNNYTKAGATPARPPSWWSITGTTAGTQASSFSTNGGGCWWGDNTYEGGTEVRSLCDNGGTYRLLIVPNVTAPTTKRIMIYVFNISTANVTATNGKVHLNSVKIGTTNYADTSFAVTPEASAGASTGGCNGVLLTVPVFPGKNIDISYSVSGTYAGSNMMFQD